MVFKQFLFNYIEIYFILYHAFSILSDDSPSSSLNRKSDSIIFVVGKSPIDIMKRILLQKKFHRKNHMESLLFITKPLDIKNPNIQILDIINIDTHKEIIAKLNYDAPSFPECGSQMKKYDFQKPFSRIKKRLSTPFNYTILTPNWKQPIISSNLSNAMPLVFGTLKTSKNGFLSP